jgi:hypothetical protein
MTSSTSNPPPVYVGDLPRDVEQRLRRFGTSHIDPDTDDLWTHDRNGAWTRWPPPEEHDRSADYSAVTRAALAPREAFAGPLVTGWAVRHDQAARHFRDYDGRMIECETFGPRSTFDLSMAPPLTLGHEKTATVVGKYVRHRNTGGGLWITWQLASDLPDAVRARLAHPTVRPQLSMAFGDGPRVEWDEYGDGRISRMWTGTVTVSHVAIVPRGAYWNTDLDLVREFV